MTSHQKGLLLTGFGGMVLTFDIPLIKLANGDVWTVQLIRYGLGLAVALIAWGAIGLWRRRPITLVPGRVGIAVAAIYGCGAMCFTAAVFNTLAANLVFILAFNTMFAALLGWLVLGERPARPTILAMAVMIGAVLLIVGDGIRSGHVFGDLLALTTSFLLACALTVTRASGKDMGFAPMVGGALPITAAIVAMAVTNHTPTLEAPWWLFANGAVLIPVSFWCIATGPKYITGPEVAMFFLLETVLAPVWVWLIFDERPTGLALAGGAILIATLVAHSLWKFSQQGSQQAPGERPARWLYPSIAVKRPRT